MWITFFVFNQQLNFGAFGTEKIAILEYLNQNVLLNCTVVTYQANSALQHMANMPDPEFEFDHEFELDDDDNSKSNDGHHDDNPKSNDGDHDL